MKKWLALTVTAVLIASLLGGCSGSPTLTGIATSEALTLAVGAESPLDIAYTFEGNVSEEAKSTAIQGLQVAYNSDNPEIAAIESGVVKGMSTGTAIITCSVGELSTETTVTVFAPLEDISLGDEAVQLTEGDNYTITVKPLPEAANLENVNFTSSDEAILSVSNTGGIQAIKAGNASVEVSCGEISKTISFEVAPLIDGISLEQTEGLLYVGISHTLVPSVLPEGLEVDYSFVSSDERVAVVDSDGVITAKGVGTTTITVSVVGHEDVSMEYALTVTNRPASGGSGNGSGSGTGGNNATGSGVPAGGSNSGGGSVNTGDGGAPVEVPYDPGNTGNVGEDGDIYGDAPIEVPYDPANPPTNVNELPDW